MQERNRPNSCCQPSGSAHQNGPAYALYYQTETLFNTAANSSIDITQTAEETAGAFYSDGSQVQILRPGTYHIVYTVNLPAETVITTTFALQANRQAIEGTSRAVAKTGADTPTTITGETILEVCAPVAVRVVSTALLDVTGEEDEVLATLFIQQLGK
ncbi:MAG: hypothetical protein IJA90_07425 [Peptococcaceae bacterium]|nr:hypothetical protein [Peptococcaceae bacterium]